MSEKLSVSTSDENNRAPWIVWGAGAIGGTIGAAFIEAGEEVIFVDNVVAHVEAINRSGLRMTGPMGDQCVRARAFLPVEMAQAFRGKLSAVLLAVKSHHTPAAMRDITPLLAPQGYVVSLQNGLNESTIAEFIGAERTVGAFINFGADFLEPGVIHFGGRGAVVIGELDGATRPRTEVLFHLLQRFEPNAILTLNIWGYLWAKMIYGALLFATALSNDSIADVLASAQCRPVLTRLAREIGSVAAAKGINLQGFDGFDPRAFLPDATAEQTTKSFDDMVAHNRRSAKSHSGIWRDLAVRKRQTEVDAQIAPVIPIGAACGIAMPLTTQLVALVHQIEQGLLPQTLSTLALLEGAANA